MTLISMPLSDEERDNLDKYTNQINDGLRKAEDSYRMMIPAILAVYDNKLYREHGTFDQWAADQFGRTGRMIRNYLQFAAVATSVGLPPDTDKLIMAHAAELAKINEDERKAVLDAVTEKNPSPTAKDIRKEVDEMVAQGRASYVNDRMKDGANRRKGREWTDMLDVWETMPLSEKRKFVGYLFDQIKDGKEEPELLLYIKDAYKSALQMEIDLDDESSSD